jgi:multimeric flavodoxin WrbA
MRAAEGVKSIGHEANFVSISSLKISPCNACDSCRKESKGSCVINDDMQSLYPKIRDADGIIFATPIYWFNMSAQMKAFIDRSYAIKDGNSYAFTGKNVGVILTYADEDVFSSGGVNALRSFQDIFAYVKANFIGMVYGTADKAGEMKDNVELSEKAFDLGCKILNS